MYEVSIRCMNKRTGKEYIFTDKASSLINVARIMLTFKPKRGYKMVSFCVNDREDEMNILDYL